MPGPRVRALMLAVAALVVVVACVSVPSPPPGVDEPSPGAPAPSSATTAGAGRPPLIKYGQDIPSPEQVAAARKTYEALPFDGIVMRTSESANIFSRNRIDYDELLEKVSALPEDLRMRDNWLRITLHDELDFTDDALWRTIAANAEDMAAALHDSGRPYVGIWFDNEWYGEGGSPWDYGEGVRPWTPSDTAGATPGLSPEEARELVRSRGQEVMAAMARGWPDLDVMVLFGPWVSEPTTQPALRGAGLHYNDIAFANELTGSFFLGMVDGRGNGRVIDGGEYYDARDVGDYEAFTAWQQRGFVEAGATSVPVEALKSYTVVVPSALAVYDRDQGADYAVHDPDTLGDLTRAALEVAEEYVWFYTEEHEWGASRSMKPPVPQDYVDAIAAARSAG